MRKVLRSCILLLLFTGALWADNVDRIVAKVGSEVILKSELDQQIDQMSKASMLPENYKRVDILNQMVDARLLVQKAKELNYTVDEERIKKAADAQIKQIQTRFKSEEEFMSELKKAGMNKFDLQNYFVEMLKEQSLKEQIIQNQIKSKIKITDSDVESYYQEHKSEMPMRPQMVNVGMIMRQVKASSETKKAQLDAINQLMDRLKKGEDFAEVARESSDCPSSKVGGDLGFFGHGMMVKPFEDAAYKLKVGQISGIVETQFGYHIIKLEEKRDEEIRVRHILKAVNPTAADTLATKTLLESVRNQYLEGSSFATLAEKYSEDDSSAVLGGSIGDFPEDGYPDLFKEQISKLQMKEITPVIDNEGTYYLFAKLASVPSRPYEFSEMKAQLLKYIESQREIKAYADWIGKVRKDNYVEILL